MEERQKNRGLNQPPSVPCGPGTLPSRGAAPEPPSEPRAGARRRDAGRGLRAKPRPPPPRGAGAPPSAAPPSGGGAVPAPDPPPPGGAAAAAVTAGNSRCLAHASPPEAACRPAGAAPVEAAGERGGSSPRGRAAPPRRPSRALGEPPATSPARNAAPRLVRQNRGTFVYFTPLCNADFRPEIKRKNKKIN